jgi:ADP-ribosyl-[dinitrogen reductase] hydrolase
MIADVIAYMPGGDEIGWRKEWVVQRMKRVRGMIDESKLRPDGYVLNSLIYAANAIRDTDNFEEALVQAVNLGGDTDTIGAITGGLAGAIYGAQAIPQRWRSALDKDIVSRMERLAELAANNS